MKAGYRPTCRNHIGFRQKKNGDFFQVGVDNRQCEVCGAAVKRRWNEKRQRYSAYGNRCESHTGLYSDDGIARLREARVKDSDPARTNDDGYILIRVVLDGGKIVRRREHRVVMESMLGRSLAPREHVHHLNGIRDDNRPENLALVSASSHERNTFAKSLQGRVRILEERVVTLEDRVAKLEGKDVVQAQLSIAT